MPRFSPKKLYSVAVAAGALCVVLPSCGGGGGGGTGNPVAPPGPPPAQVSGNLRGSVNGFTNPSSNFQGTRVQLEGGASTTVSANNEFSFDNIATGNQRLEFTGPNHLARRVNVNVPIAGIGRFDNIELVETGSFNLAAFDEIYRSFQVEGTVRWKVKPSRVLLDRDSLGVLPQGLGFFEREVKRAFATWLPSPMSRRSGSA